MSHPAAESLELYVIGAHDQVSVPEIEDHLRACDDCTAEVRRQVQVDLALAEVAAEAAFCPGCGAVMVAASCAHCGAVAEAGGFRVERVIVQNARGRMYLARDGAGNAVALKELAFVQAPHPDAVEAFEREARLLRQLSHPQIPRFLASFRQGEGVHTRLYLAQEYVEGESLQDRLASHQFSEEETLDVAGQVLGILVYLQGLSPMVFHRDIKPANLIRRADGRIALVDFGAARDLGATVGATLVGTFGYMPVEQMGGIVDASTDLYALGSTLCHLVSRREPWKFMEDPRALERLNVSRGFREYLTRLTARRPEDRYGTAAAALRALRPPTKRRWPTASVGRPHLMALTALLGITVLGAGVLVRGSHPAQTDLDGTQSIDSEILQADVPEGFPERTLLLQVCTAANGEVKTVNVLRGTLDDYGQKALAQATRWTYGPVFVDGKPVAQCRKVKFTVRAH
jgi:serine/threonine protein kinase